MSQRACTTHKSINMRYPARESKPASYEEARVRADNARITFADIEAFVEQFPGLDRSKGPRKGSTCTKYAAKIFSGEPQ